MRSNNRSTPRSLGLRTLSAAVLAAMAMHAQAAGLGKLTVLSSLGQPLNAEIELNSVSKDEAGNLQPRLAPADAYRQANIEINPALYSLRFALEERGGRQIIRVTSTQAINEPFIDMLIELGGSSGKLMREYTFLLDPPELKSGGDSGAVAANRRTPASTTPAASASSTPAATRPAEPVAMPAERPKREPRTPRAPAIPPAEQVKTPAASTAMPATEGSGDYRVKAGDTLSKIAGQFHRDGISLDQMLVALYRANPDAFVGNNMNRLRSGQVISVPNNEAIAAIAEGEAHGIVIAQARDFNAYRNKLAGQVENANARPVQESKQTSSGKITTKVEEKPNAATTAQDKLKLSAPTANSKDSKAEEKIAKDKALADAKAREKELERNVKDLQGVIAKADEKKPAAKDAKAAEAKPADNKAAATKPAEAKAPEAKPADNKTAATKPAEVKAPETKPAESKPDNKAAAKPAEAKAPESKPADVKPAEVKPTETKPADTKVADAKPAESKPAAADAAAASAQASAEAPKPAKPKPKVGPKVPVQAPKAPEPSFLDDILGSYALWGGLGTLIAGAGGIFAYNAWRKKKEKSFGDSIITDSSLKANSLFGSTGGQSVDTNNSVFNSNFVPSASQLDSNEVDPVAEADVYIAYGRDAQAEEILKEALRTQPERDAVRLKLLEIYANRKDVRAFETLASELYERTKGEGEDWMAAANLGIALDPNNPMYAAGKAPDASTAALTAPTRPVDPSADLESLLASTEMAPSNALESVSESPYFGDSALHGDSSPTTIAPLTDTNANTVAPKLPELGTPTSLDFDLDGLSDDTVAPAVPEPVATAPAEPAKHDDNVMEFGGVDFDVLKPAPVAAAPAPVAHEEHVPHLDLPDLDIASISAAPVDEPVHHAAASAPVLDIPGLDHAPAHAAAPAHDAGKGDGGGNALDFDLSGISLDLNPPAHTAAPAVKTEPHAAPVHEPALDLAHAGHAADVHAGHEMSLDGDLQLDTEFDHDPSANAEMATKLDLAVAYQEIGDKEGARELLEEVMKGGSPEQSEKAKSLLAKLG